MRHNRWFAAGLIAATAAALTLAGCSTSDDNGGDPNVKLISIFWKGSEQPGIDAAVAAYKEAHPDIQLVSSIAQTEQYQATLRTQLSAGTAADIVFVWPGDGNPGAIRQVAPGGFLEDLSDQPWVKDLPESLQQVTAIDGKTYMLPMATSSFGPWYNQDVLDATGLTPPSEWNQVLQFCADAQAAGKIPYTLGAAVLNNAQNPLVALQPDLVYGPDRDHDKTLADGDTTFSTNEGWKTAMDEYQQMVEAGCFTPDATGVSQDEQNNALARGDAVGMFSLGYQLAGVVKAAPDTEFNLYPLSGDDDPDTNLLAVGNAGGAAINTKSQNKELAIDFLKWLASPEGMTIYNDALAATAPAIPTGEAGDRNRELMNEYLTDDRAVHFLNTAWPNARIEQTMFAGLQGILAGTGTGEDVLKAMDGEYKN